MLDEREKERQGGVGVEGWGWPLGCIHAASSTAPKASRVVRRWAGLAQLTTPGPIIVWR